MRHGDYKKAVRTEGGTGLHKVQKIIRHDFGTNGAMRFDYLGSESFVVIHVANTVAPSSVTPGSRARLDAIRSAMRHGDYKKAVRTEGGTGLHKVQKIIRHDFGTNGA